MPTLRIDSPYASSQEVNAPEGGALMDLCDQHGAMIPFSCRSGACGTCRVAVLDGLELLVPAEEDEQDLLDLFVPWVDPKASSPVQPSPPRPVYRLACCAQVRAGGGRLHLRSVEDQE